jgi:hypothetical protein
MTKRAFKSSVSKIAKRDLGCEVDVRPARAEDVLSIARLDEVETGQ